MPRRMSFSANSPGTRSVDVRKSSRQRRKSDKCYAEFPARIEDSDLDVATPERVLGLHRGNGVHALGPADCRSRNFRKPDFLYLALLDKSAQRTDAVLDRHWRALVEAMQVIQVDDVGLQAAERILDVILQFLRPAIDCAHTVLATHAALADKHDVVAMWFQIGSDELLVAAEAVQRCAVEMGDAQVQGTPQDSVTRLLARRYTVGMREIHAAEPDRRHGVGAQFSVRECHG